MRGIVLGVDADKLIVQANDAEIEHFTLGTPVAVQNRPHFIPGDFPVHPGEMVYNKDGQAVGYVTDLQIQTDLFDMGTHGNPWQSFAKAGRRNVTMTVRGSLA